MNKDLLRLWDIGTSPSLENHCVVYHNYAIKDNNRSFKYHSKVQINGCHAGSGRRKE